MRALALAALLLAGCDGGNKAPRDDSATDGWQIGPVIGGENYSKGLSSTPTIFPDGWGFEISPAAEPHYITKATGSLAGKGQIRMRFRVDGPPSAIIHGAGCAPSSPSGVTLYFQPAHVNWSRDGGRWWATFATTALRGPMAETEIIAPLDGRWTSVMTMNAADNPDVFAADKANAGRVGFTFANCEGYGHGAVATEPVQFVVTTFEIN